MNRPFKNQLLSPKKSNIMKFTSLFLCIVSLMTSACNFNETTSADTTLEEDSSASSSVTCVFDFQDKYDQLLPLETIQKHYSGEMSSAKMIYNKSANAEGQKRDSYVYSWPSDRTKTIKIGNNEMNVPLPNEIGIKWLGDDLYKIMNKESAIASFKAFYKTVSQKEVEEALDKAEAKMLNNEAINEETKSQASDMAAGLSKGAEYQPVAGVADAAAWDVRDNALIILVGERTLKVVANMTENTEENKALAIKLAGEVLVRCD